MIRISRARRGSETVVTVAGRLDSAHVAQLEAECEAAGEPVVLDLSELQSADSEGVRWLKSFENRGASVTDKSPYIALLLERAEEAR